MEHHWLAFRVLCLIGVANVAPILAKALLRERWERALDGGRRCVDARPFLGPAKTIRGVVAAVIATALAAPALGVPILLGAAIGAAAMAGDMLSSFAKRRLGVPPSGQALGLDQIPEALVPLLVVHAPLDLSLPEIFGVTAAFFGLHLVFARLFYHLGICERPY
jgi:CDP-2,3-bis-(O-geranylgeranyl)-sn-glycerol synthase